MNTLTKNGRWGYATRSLRSALLMKSIDLLNPLACDYGPADIRGECVISSIAGIGDLFIHLPLIEGICVKVRENSGKSHVPLIKGPLRDIYARRTGRETSRHRSRQTVDPKK